MALAEARTGVLNLYEGTLVCNRCTSVRWALRLVRNLLRHGREDDFSSSPESVVNAAAIATRLAVLLASLLACGDGAQASPSFVDAATARKIVGEVRILQQQGGASAMLEAELACWSSVKSSSSNPALCMIRNHAGIAVERNQAELEEREVSALYTIHSAVRRSSREVVELGLTDAQLDQLFRIVDQLRETIRMALADRSALN